MMRDTNSIWINTLAVLRRLSIRLVVVLMAMLVTVVLMGDFVEASDPSPVNPSGPIPVALTDSAGKRYEIFTPEEGGSVMGEGYSFEAQPGDVPNASIVGVHMRALGVASNAGKTHHRYTFAGSYYTIDAVDANGRKLSQSSFSFRRAPEACVPFTNEHSANIDKLALIATNMDGTTQTVLNSRVRFDGAELKICGYLGSIPAVVAAGLRGAPDPLPPTPVIVEDPPVAPLPETGGASVPRGFAMMIMIVGAALICAGLLFALSRRVSLRRM